MSIQDEGYDYTRGVLKFRVNLGDGAVNLDQKHTDVQQQPKSLRAAIKVCF